MRALVCGGRNYRDWKRVWDVLDDIHTETPITLLIDGAASGVDSFAHKWAVDAGIPTERYPAKWDDLDWPGAKPKQREDGSMYDSAAGYRRNAEMLEKGKPDLVVAFPGGRGTDMMTGLASLKGIPIRKYW